ncbi:hypothetical protein DFH28DRAFT_879047 [Melampsora americana]|nr:hypothetical protein DFH28DRAFT_879047 [Melampsora americana]
MPRLPSPRTTLPSKPYSQAKTPKQTSHFPERFKPETPGHQFDNCYNINSRVNQYVRQMLFEVKAEVINFDLAVANFLFETSHLDLPDIPRSVEIVFNNYDVLFPLVSCDHNVLTCALQIQSTVKLYCQNPSTTTKTFALRFPNIKALKKLIAKKSKLPRVSESEKAIVLVDLEGRFLAMGLPPSPKYKKQTENRKSGPQQSDNNLPKGDDSPEVCRPIFLYSLSKSSQCSGGIHLLTPSASVHWPYAKINCSALASRQSDWSLRWKICSPLSTFEAFQSLTPRTWCPSWPSWIRAIFGVTANKLCWMQPDARTDRKIQLGFDQQGYNLGDLGDWPTSDSHLPVAMGLGEESLFKRTDNADRLQELYWAYKVSRVLNASVQPEMYKIAQDVVNFVAKNSGPFVPERLYRLHNCIVHGQHVNYNMQVALHRDGKNCNLIDSVFAYGRDYTSGHWIFSSLGVSFCADPGYLVHAFFKYLDHAVDTILPTSDKPPQQILLALYLHADFYSGPARISGARVRNYNDSSKVTSRKNMVFWYQSS